MSAEQTESHSAQFGLEPQSKPTQNAGSGPGSGIEGTTGVAGHKNSASGGPSAPDKGTTVGGVAQPSDGAERPGAGSSTITPSQGSNKNADESGSTGGLLDKLNPLK